MVDRDVASTSVVSARTVSDSSLPDYSGNKAVICDHCMTALRTNKSQFLILALVLVLSRSLSWYDRLHCRLLYRPFLCRGLESLH
jgi:hypothetical protein